MVNDMGYKIKNKNGTQRIEGKLTGNWRHLRDGRPHHPVLPPATVRSDKTFHVDQDRVHHVMYAIDYDCMVLTENKHQ
jgi:hypothetical protein